jgi:hypothetical protein
MWTACKKRRSVMAIAFTRAKIISRAKGQSAVACAAYRSGEELEDERYGKTHNYKRKEKILYTGLEAPEGAKNYTRQELWNEVEKIERRKDSQLAKEFILALPHELSSIQQKAIVQDIAKYLTDQGMYVDWAVHGAPKHGDKRNIHAHILTTMREVTAKGFENKNREWNSKEWLKNFRQHTLDVINKHLENKLEFIENNEKGLPKSHHYGPERFNQIRRIEKQRSEINQRIEAVESEIKAEHTAIEKAESEKTRPVAQPQSQPLKKTEVKKPVEKAIEPKPAYKKYSISDMMQTAKELQKLAESGKPDEAKNQWDQYYRQTVAHHKGTVRNEQIKNNNDDTIKWNQKAKDYKLLKSTHPEMFKKPEKPLPEQPPLFGKKAWDELKEQWEAYRKGQEAKEKIQQEKEQFLRITSNRVSETSLENNARSIVETWIDKYKIRPILDLINRLVKANRNDRQNESQQDRGR